MTVPKKVIDQDTTDDYLDVESIRYSDGKTLSNDVSQKAISEREKLRGHKLPKLPPPTQR